MFKSKTKQQIELMRATIEDMNRIIESMAIDIEELKNYDRDEKIYSLIKEELDKRKAKDGISP